MASQESFETNEVLSSDPWAKFLGVESPDSLSYEAFKQENDRTKLHYEDMSLYGYCPAFDDVYLVICNYCQKVFKPPSLKSHIERKHSEENSQSKEDSATTVSPSNLNESATVAHGIQYSKSLSLGAKTINVRQTEKNNSCGSSHPLALSENLTSTIKVKSGSRSKKPLVLIKKIDSGITASNDASTVKESDEKVPPVKASTVFSATSKNLLSSTSGPGPGGNIVFRSNLSSSDPTSSLIEQSSESISDLKTEVKNVPDFKKSAAVYGIKRGPPCRSREYDHDKHCGVVIPETGRPCTRAITSCSVHPISLRRRVLGRTKPCDELIKKQKEYRALKRTSVESSIASESPPSKLPSLVNQRIEQLVPNTSNNVKSRQSLNSIFIKPEASQNTLLASGEQTTQCLQSGREQSIKQIDSSTVSKCDQTINCFSFNNEMSLHADMNQPLKSLLPKHHCAEEQQGKLPAKDQLINYLLTDQQPVKLVLLQSNQYSEINQPIEYTFPSQSVSSVQPDTHLFNYVISNNTVSPLVQGAKYINTVLPAKNVCIQETQPLNFLKPKLIDELQSSCTIVKEQTLSSTVSNEYIFRYSEEQEQSPSSTVVREELSNYGTHGNQASCALSDEQYFHYSVNKEPSLNYTTVPSLNSSLLDSESLKSAQQSQSLHYLTSENFMKTISQEGLSDTNVLPQKDLFHCISGEKVLISVTEEEQKLKPLTFVESQSLIANEGPCLNTIFLESKSSLLPEKETVEHDVHRIQNQMNVIKDSDVRILNFNSLSEQQTPCSSTQSVGTICSYTTTVPASELNFSLGIINSKSNLQNGQLSAEQFIKGNEIRTYVSSIPSKKNHSSQRMSSSNDLCLSASISQTDSLSELNEDTKPSCIPLILHHKPSAVCSLDLRKSKCGLTLLNEQADPGQASLIKTEENMCSMQKQEKNWNFKQATASEESNDAYNMSLKLVSSVSENEFLTINELERCTDEQIKQSQKHELSTSKKCFGDNVLYADEIIFDKSLHERHFLTNDQQASSSSLSYNVQTKNEHILDWKALDDNSESSSTIITVKDSMPETQHKKSQTSLEVNESDSNLITGLDPCNTTAFPSPLSNHVLATELSVSNFIISQKDLLPVAINF